MRRHTHEHSKITSLPYFILYTSSILQFKRYFYLQFAVLKDSTAIHLVAKVLNRRRKMTNEKYYNFLSEINSTEICIFPISKNSANGIMLCKIVLAFFRKIKTIVVPRNVTSTRQCIYPFSLFFLFDYNSKDSFVSVLFSLCMSNRSNQQQKYLLRLHTLEL